MYAKRKQLNHRKKLLFLIRMSLRERDNFPFLEDKVYFHNAGTGAIPESTIKTIEQYIVNYYDTLIGTFDWNEGLSRYRGVKKNSKKLFAEIIGANMSEVAFVPNASTGINTAFSMIPFKKGDNVVLSELSYPMCTTVVLNQRKKGVEPRFLPHKGGIVETSQWEKTIDDDTKAVMVDQAGWFNGFLHNIRAIAEIAHEHGAYLVVDGTQSVGGLSWDIHDKGVDFLTCSVYKWLLGGPANNTAGFLYIKEAIVDNFQADYVGEQALKAKKDRIIPEDKFFLYDFEPRKGIERIEIYNQSEFSYVAVENSMKLLLRHGIDKVEKQIKKVDTKIIDGLNDMGVELATPLEEERRLFINAKIPDYKKVCLELAKDKVYVSPRVGGMRISPGAYNEVEEAEAFLEKLSKFL